MLIETFIRWYKGLPTIKLNDAFGSISNGVLLVLIDVLLLRFVEISLYLWAYENINVIQLPWDSSITWWTCLIAYDFMFYWIHRLTHGKLFIMGHYCLYNNVEINIFWSAHQVHHSSQYYNLTTALRQSIFQDFIAIVSTNRIIM